MKLMDILDEIILEIKQKKQYPYTEDWEKNWLFSNLMLSELLNPNNAYEYKNHNNEIWSFIDSTDIKFCAIMNYTPGKVNFCEFKTWWIDPETNKRIYNYLPQTTSMDWDKRSDTVAKIFRDEVIPRFKNQKFANILIINPIDSQRYQFSLRMIKKFIPKEWKIIEKFPKQILIDKNEE